VLILFLVVVLLSVPSVSAVGAVAPQQAKNVSIAVKGNVAYVHYLQGVLSQNSGKVEGAISAFKKAAELDPENAFLRVELLRTYIALGRMDEAIREGESAIREIPGNPGIMSILAEAYFYRGDYANALTMFDEVIKLDPGNAEAVMYLAMLELEKKPQRAVELYKQYLASNPEDVEVLQKLVDAYRRVGKVEELLSVCDRILELTNMPNILEFVFLTRAEVYEKTKQWDKSVESYVNAIMLGERYGSAVNEVVYAKLGVLYYDLKKREDAKAVFEKLLAHAPENKYALTYLALLAEEEKKIDIAAGYFEKLVRSTKNADPKNVFHLAYLYGRLGKNNQAVEMLREAVRLDPNSPDYHYFLGVGYIDEKKLSAAEHELRRAVELQPEYHEAYFRLGVVYDQQKKFDKFEKCMQKVVELNPGNASALNYLAYTYADRNIKLEKALELVNKALVLEPGIGAYIDTLGWVYFRMGRKEDALRELLLSAEKEKDFTVYGHIGDVYYSMNQYESAYEWWQKAVSCAPEKDKGLFTGKIEGAGNRISPGTAVRKLLKRYESNQKTYIALNGTVKIHGLPSGEVSAVFNFCTPRNFRVDILGFMSISRGVVVYRDGIIDAYPGAVNAVASLPEEQMGALLKTITSWLNGDIAGRYDNPGYGVKDNKTVYTIGDSGQYAVLAKAGGLMHECVYTDELYGAVRIMFSGYEYYEGVWLPSKVFIELKKYNLRFTLSFGSYVINQKRDDKMFLLDNYKK